MKWTKWVDDPGANKTYNIMGSFEALMINLGIVSYGNQWDIDQLNTFSMLYEKHRENSNGRKFR